MLELGLEGYLSMTRVRGYHRLLDLEWLNGKTSSLGVGRHECLLSGGGS
jgi:hypothetical protein